MLKVRFDDRAIARDMSKFVDKQFRFAQAQALTKVAKFSQMDIRVAAAREFASPTPYTINSTYVRPATPSKPEASVGWKDSGRREHYLAAQVHGGHRIDKRFEFHLRRAGALSNDEFVVPAKGYPLDGFGSIPRKVYAAILADLQAHPDERTRSTAESRAKRTRRRKIGKRAIYFLAPRGGKLPRGIYERTWTAFGSAIRGVFMIVSRPSYRARLPMQQIVQQNISEHLEAQLHIALSAAVATAR